MHDAVAGWNDVDIFKCGLGPLDKMKTIFITTIFNSTVLLEGIFLEASMFLSGAGPIYTQASSTDELKLFSSVYALFSTLVVVTSVAVLAIPIVHRVIHRLHINRKKNR